MYKIIRLTLQMFLRAFKPLKSPIVMELTINKEIHNFNLYLDLVNTGFMFLQSAGDVKHARRELSLSRGGPRAPVNMDAITWMGVCAWRKGFSCGVS